VQWLLQVLVVQRFIHNPLTQYIDLLFLANISALIMDDRNAGYYLHGRNQLHHTGTN
jgi:meckelin